MTHATISILTPPEPGAIAVLQIESPDTASLERAAALASIPLSPVGTLRVASIAGVDLGVITRWTETTLHLTPHAGPAVVGEIVRRLGAAGIPLVRAESVDPRALYPEAADEVEARMLWTLSRAASPLAIDLLLDQPRRWRVAGAASDPARDRILNRLIAPPTVVAFGPPNIGKSTLCNALAGRSVAIVADEEGTTRDHVGVLIDAGGVVVRYVDTPGMAAVEGMGAAARVGASRDEAAAVEITRRVLESADLVLRCGDGGSEPLELPGGVRPIAGALTVGLRSDLGAARFERDVDVSAAAGVGVSELGAMIREKLVPRPAMRATGAWRFW